MVVGFSPWRVPWLGCIGVGALAEAVTRAVRGTNWDYDWGTEWDYDWGTEWGTEWGAEWGAEWGTEWGTMAELLK